LVVAEEGKLTDSLKKRLVVKESQLQNVERELANLTGQISTIEDIDSAWVRRKLSRLSELLQNHTEAIGVFRTALKNVFPDKLVVRAVEHSGRTSSRYMER